MKKLLLITSFFILSITQAFSQNIIATTENGKVVLLKSDGTWEYASTPNTTTKEPIRFIKSKVVLKKADYSDISSMQITDQIQAYFQFENLSQKTVTGIQFKFSFYDSFGDELYISEAKSNLVISPGKINPMKTYYYWEDNPFINGEPYDKLQSATSAGTIKTKVSIILVMFDDGSSFRY